MHNLDIIFDTETHKSDFPFQCMETLLEESFLVLHSQSYLHNAVSAQENTLAPLINILL